jgi:hypothetical protein
MELWGSRNTPPRIERTWVTRRTNLGNEKKKNNNNSQQAFRSGEKNRVTLRKLIFNTVVF